jgi:hypothetical protein
MNENIFCDDVRVSCADGVIREGCSLTIYNGAYAYLDADGQLLDGDRAVTEFLGGKFGIDPFELGKIVYTYGPLNT